MEASNLSTLSRRINII